MKHDHGAILYTTKKKNGNFNLWERNLMYGHKPQKIAENLTIEEIINWREKEYRGLEALPFIFDGPIKRGKILVKEEWKKA